MGGAMNFPRPRPYRWSAIGRECNEEIERDASGFVFGVGRLGEVAKSRGRSWIVAGEMVRVDGDDGDKSR